MENTATNATTNSVEHILSEQRQFFDIGETKAIDFRRKSLKKLKSAILSHEKQIADALWTDLHKCYEEAYITEISIVLHEIDNHVKYLGQWAKPKQVPTPFFMLPSSSKIIYEPLGVALIISPWNYPFQLPINSLIGAISAGCCAVLKPSPDAPSVAKVLEDMLRKMFIPNYITVVQGGKEVNEVLLAQRFDTLFFTGSPKVGKVVMRAASKFLTPVVLELGGKSPCIVDADANIEVAAKRIAWGKTINTGQTCIAPDYLYVHESIKERLLDRIAAHIDKMYGPDIKQSPHFGRIVSREATERLKTYLEGGTIVYGGEIDVRERYVAPTIIDDVQTDFPVMKAEIFGPILPVLTFRDIGEAIDFVNDGEKPLAFYFFGSRYKAASILAQTSSGGGCVNDTLLYLANQNLPYGGVGNSGMGKYHGRDSFLSFTNQRSVVTSSTWIDIPLKYAPYKRFKWLKKLL